MGITIDEAARVTRIGRQYLLSLEEDNYDSLPSPAYARGFIRSYATFLGLPDEKILARFDCRNGQTPGRHEEKSSPGIPYPLKKPAKHSWWTVPLVLFLFVVIFAYLFEGREPKQKNASIPENTLAKIEASKPVLLSRSSSHAVARNAVVAKGGDAPLKQPNAEIPENGIYLRLKVNQDCWLNITIDDTVSQQYDLKAGDLISWKGDKVFTLDLGNPGGVEGEFNGKPLKPFGVQGKPVHVVLTGDTPP